MANNIRERFEKDFHKGFVSEGSILAFFRQELLALAEEVSSEANGRGHEGIAVEVARIALARAATLIRSKADELL